MPTSYQTLGCAVLKTAIYARFQYTYADTIVSYANRIQETWIDGQIFDLFDELMTLTMRAFGKVLLDVDLWNDAKELNDARITLWEWINHVATRIFVLPLTMPTPHNKRVNKALSILREQIGAMIKERRIAERDRGDILSMLISARYDNGDRVSNSQIYDETVALLFAAHETNASALSWTFYLLSHHPNIYTKLQKEVDSALQGRLPNYADLQNLPYTLQVLKEAMRLYPPAARQFRVALRDTQLGSYPIRKNTTVMFSQYLLHRHPNSFPIPEQFDPNRFSAESESLLHRFAHIPFGGGKRICLGNHYAMMEGHLILATLAQRVSFELAPQQQKIIPTLAVTLRPSRKVWVKVRRRL